MIPFDYNKPIKHSPPAKSAAQRHKLFSSLTEHERNLRDAELAKLLHLKVSFTVQIRVAYRSLLSVTSN
jgi:hypothetical protein